MNNYHLVLDRFRREGSVRIPQLLRLHEALSRVLRAACWPALDLVLRLALAQSFFVSGLLKASNWPNALYLATNEYPVSWLSPVTAAYTGVTIELLGASLLAVGLMSRYAALSMLILTLVIQFSYKALDAQLFSAALLGWYVLHGAGSLSLDGRLAPRTCRQRPAACCANCAGIRLGTDAIWHLYIFRCCECGWRSRFCLQAAT